MSLHSSKHPTSHLYSGMKKNMLLAISSLQRKGQFALLKAFRDYFSSSNRWYSIFVKGSHLPTHHGSERVLRDVLMRGKRKCSVNLPIPITLSLLIDFIKENVAGTQMQSRFSCVREHSAMSVKQTSGL